MAYHVEVGGPVHLYAKAIPAGATAVGVIRSENGDTGALLRFRSGAYAQMNDDGVRPLDAMRSCGHCRSGCKPASESTIVMQTGRPEAIC